MSLLAQILKKQKNKKQHHIIKVSLNIINVKTQHTQVLIFQILKVTSAGKQ